MLLLFLHIATSLTHMYAMCFTLFNSGCAYCFYIIFFFHSLISAGFVSLIQYFFLLFLKQVNYRKKQKHKIECFIICIRNGYDMLWRNTIYIYIYDSFAVNCSHSHSKRLIWLIMCVLCTSVVLLCVYSYTFYMRATHRQIVH